MIEKRLKSGAIAYYWNPPNTDIKKGFSLHREALGSEYGAAAQRSDELNQHLKDWRRGLGTTKDLDLQPGYGTLAWLVERYYRSREFERVSARVQPSYRRELSLVTDYQLRNGKQAGSLLLTQISARFVDKLYVKLLVGPKKKRRVRQANVCISRVARAWEVVRRLYPKVVPTRESVQRGHTRN